MNPKIQTTPLNDTDPDHEQILREMERRLEEAMNDPAAIREKAVEVIGAQIQDNDLQAAASLLNDWVQANVTYVPDPHDTEYIQSPQKVLRDIEARGKAAGDCDCRCMMLAALLRSVGIDTRFAAVQTDYKELGDKAPFDHVIVLAGFPGGGVKDIDPCAPGGYAPNYPVKVYITDAGAPMYGDAFATLEKFMKVFTSPVVARRLTNLARRLPRSYQHTASTLEPIAGIVALSQFGQDDGGDGGGFDDGSGDPYAGSDPSADPSASDAGTAYDPQTGEWTDASNQGGGLAASDIGTLPNDSSLQDGIVYDNLTGAAVGYVDNAGNIRDWNTDQVISYGSALYMDANGNIVDSAGNVVETAQQSQTDSTEGARQAIAAKSGGGGGGSSGGGSSPKNPSPQPGGTVAPAAASSNMTTIALVGIGALFLIALTSKGSSRHRRFYRNPAGKKYYVLQSLQDDWYVAPGGRRHTSDPNDAIEIPEEEKAEWLRTYGKSRYRLVLKSRAKEIE